MASRLGSRSITLLLDAIEDDGSLEGVAGADLFEEVYEQLHELARRHRASWSGNETLNTTALIHEAYLKLERGDGRFESRAHFLAVASKAMRHILISYARAQSAEKRGGGAAVLPLHEVGAAAAAPARFGELIALEDALAELQAADARAARVVECRFFGGMTIQETADALGVSPSTVTRTWRAAQAWLYRRLREAPEAAPSEGDDAAARSSA